ncbi:MAG: isoaspartyl peptidase/L-asparaginase [Myxococcaceae bacterium]|nr:isoaspartyl peptidase/L-asparaginase [Myxococcaceae bacterium]
MSFSLAVHGGAGPRAPDDDGPGAVAGCLAAMRAGKAVLAAGGSALDAVVEAVRCLEEDERFNAGKGAALTRDGEVALDASVMSGAGRTAGGVALLRTVRNPVVFARAVMERSPHVLLAGEGAEAFAVELGLERVPTGWHVTDRARAQLERWKTQATAGSGGTVGAVARDARGHVAAATSTGGTTGKWRGRIGDSPIPGAGTWADDATGAVSCTGAGEQILRLGLAKTVSELLASGRPAKTAARAALRQLDAQGGTAGLIVVDRRGRLGLVCTTERMACAWVDSRGNEGSRFER